MVARNISTNHGTTNIYDGPDHCPFCHKSIVPVYISGLHGIKDLSVLLLCPNSECQKAFIAYYFQSGGIFYYSNETSIGSLNKRDFSTQISEISKSFVEIYNQAFQAEQYKLLEICGVGYRKSIEYLIKDYLIFKNPDLESIIKNLFLNNCINDYVTDTKIKSVAKRAVWLGNDETHYERKWEGKDLDDLKKLIDLTIHWIEMEKLTESFELDMPDSKK